MNKTLQGLSFIFPHCNLQSRQTVSSTHHRQGDIYEPSFLENLSPPDYGEIRQAIRSRSLTDCLDYFLASGLATDDHDAIEWLRAWQEKQEVTGGYDCPRCHIPSREVGKKPKYITLECENCGSWIKWLPNHTIRESLARLESPRHEQPNRQVTLNNLTDNRYLIGGES